MSKPRQMPGQSVAQRLFKRAGRRMHVGPKPAFYQRLGVEDPLAADPGLVQDAQKEMFSFLSASGYYDAVDRAQGRGRMLARSSRLATPRAGRRILRSGPEAIQPRASTLAALTVAPEAVTLSAREESEQTPTPEIAAAPPRRRSAVHTAPRPMARVMAHTEDGGTELARALAQELRTARGADRVALGRVLDRVRKAPAAEQGRIAKVALRREMPRQAGVRSGAIQAIEQADASPVAVASSRMAQEGTSRGLRRVLGSSPSILTLEQPPAARPEAPPPARRRAATHLPAAQPAPSREIPVAAPVREARSQQVSGRAGPRQEGARADQSAAWSRPQHRPTEWVASLVASSDHAESATTRGAYGLPTGGFRQAREVGTERVAARGRAASVELGAGPVLSRSTTGWLTDVLQPTRDARIASPSMVVPEPRGQDAGTVESDDAPQVGRGSRGAARQATLPQSVRAAARLNAGPAPKTDRAASLAASPVARIVETLQRAGLSTKAVQQLGLADSRGLAASPVARLAAAERMLQRGEPLDWTPARGLGLASEAMKGLTVAPAAAEQASESPASLPRAVERPVAQTPVASRRGGTRHAAERGQAVTLRESAGLGVVPPSQRIAEGLPTSVRLMRRDQAPVADTLSRSPVGHLRGMGAPEVAFLTPALSEQAEASAVSEDAPRGAPAARNAVERAERTVQADSRGAARLAPAPAARADARSQVAQRDGAALRASARAERAPRRVEGRRLLSPDHTSYLKPEAQDARLGRPESRRPERVPPTPARTEAEVREGGASARPSRQPDLGASGASERAARRLELGAVGEGTRSPLSLVPTSYLTSDAAIAPDRTDLRSGRTDLRSDRADVSGRAVTSETSSLRAAARADRVARVDERGRSLLSESPTAYLRVGEVAPPSQGLDAPRRQRAVAPAMELVGSAAESRVAPESASGAEQRAVIRETRARLRSGGAGRWISQGQGAQPLTEASAGQVESGPMTRMLQRSEATESSLVPRAAAPRDLRYLMSDQGTSDPDEPVVAPRRRRVQAATVAGRRQARVRQAAQAGRPEALRAQGVGTFDRAALERVLAQVQSVVRAADRADQSAVTSEVVRRALGEVPDAAVRVRYEDAPAMNPVLPMAWAERRASGEGTVAGRPVGRPASTSRRPALQRTAGETFVQGPTEPLPGAPRRPSLADTWGWMTGLQPEPVVASSWSERAADAGIGRDTRTGGDARTGTAARGAGLSPALAERQSARSRGARRAATWDERARFVRPERGESRTSAPEDTTGLVLGDGASEEARVPSWARRGGVEPVAQTQEGARGRSLLGALAQATRPDDLLEVILSRGAGLAGEARELPPATARLIQRVANAAEAAGAQGVRQKGSRGGTTASTRDRVVRRDILHTVRAHHTPSSNTGTSAGHAGVGANNVMKLADKLMGLIHLAEVERKVQEAQKHVRMAADTAEARAEGGAGGAGSEAGSDDEMNIKALQQEVLESVLRDLELIQQRREDPDGRSIWW